MCVCVCVCVCVCGGGGGRDEWQIVTSGEIEDSGSILRGYNADATVIYRMFDGFLTL